LIAQGIDESKYHPTLKSLSYFKWQVQFALLMYDQYSYTKAEQHLRHIINEAKDCRVSESEIQAWGLILAEANRPGTRET
jgi:hypothetical protein